MPASTSKPQGQQAAHTVTLPARELERLTADAARTGYADTELAALRSENARLREALEHALTVRCGIHGDDPQAESWIIEARAALKAQP